MGIKSLWKWISYIVCDRSKEETEILVENHDDIEYGSTVKFSHHHDFHPAIKQSRNLVNGDGSYNVYVIDPDIV